MPQNEQLEWVDPVQWEPTFLKSNALNLTLLALRLKYFRLTKGLRFLINDALLWLFSNQLRSWASMFRHLEGLPKEVPSAVPPANS